MWILCTTGNFPVDAGCCVGDRLWACEWMAACDLGIGKEHRMFVPSENDFVHRCGCLPGGAPSTPSTGDPQMGIDARIAQNGHGGTRYPQYYPHLRSTPGDILGIKTVRRRRGCVRDGFVKRRGWSWRRPWLGLNAAREIGDLVEQRATLSHQLADLSVCMHHCGVVPAPERLTDFWKREIS